MALTLTSENQALLDAQLELWHHALGYIKSMALKCALDLRIADTIQQHGGVATLPQIVSSKAAATTLHPSKLPYLRRLMRVLTVTGVFSVVEHDPAADGGDEQLAYGLTPTSRLLVSSSTPTTTTDLSPFLAVMLDRVTVSPFLGLGEWFQHELLLPDHHPTTLFKMAHGQNAWDFAGRDVNFTKLFNDGMAADSSFNMDIIVKECSDVFHGVTSLTDVAGGLGAASRAISKAFPHVKCSVLDLPHVVASAPVDTDVKYIAGDMFESIPPANAVFLKWVLHDWGDAECVKILRNCRKAIPPREAGGKVIIFDMVVGAGTPDDVKHRETQVLFDLFIMSIDGVERDEEGWKKIISEAGFSDYKIIPVLGVRSIIEVYP